MKNAKIIIIGSGAAGIAAASRLFEQGFEHVTILEAEDRIGGRIHSQKFGQGLIEFGAQWCHGEVGNIVHNLVKDLNVLEASRNSYTFLPLYGSKGEMLDQTVTDKLFGLSMHVQDGESADERAESADLGASYGEYCTKMYNEKVNEMFGNDKTMLDVAAKILDFLHKMELCYDPAPSWMDISLENYFTYKVCDGYLLLHWGKNGYKTVFDVLMKTYPKPWTSSPFAKNIIFNKEVSRIKWGEKCTVSCSDGTAYQADHVVCTMSLGVLKNIHHTLFQPQLPSIKQNYIEGLCFGKVTKLFLKFDHKWWSDECVGFSFVWDKDDSVNLPNEFHHGPIKNGRSWLEDVFGFYIVDGEPNTLLGWMVGAMAPDVELLDTEILKQGCIFLMKKFLSNHYDLSEPEEVLVSKWNSNPHFVGTYSYRGVDTEKRCVRTKDITEPLCNGTNIPVVFFAGEATHPHYYSTVHGAIETGFREADRIVDIYRSRRNSKL